MRHLVLHGDILENPMRMRNNGHGFDNPTSFAKA